MLFKYHYFEWVIPWPGIGLWVHWGIMAVCAFAIMVGYHYRLALLVFTCGFTYNFLLDQTLYLNHYYMVIIFCVIMLFVPAHCKWSVDANHRGMFSATVPRWSIVVLLLQLEIILIWAGIVKLNMDWLNLEPLRMWMHARRDGYPPVFTWLTGDIGIALGAYGSIALHLLGAPLLIFRWARPWVLAAYAVFHLLNHMVFSIGIFPWFTWFASLLFFSPDWPLKFRDRYLRKWSRNDSAGTPGISQPLAQSAADTPAEKTNSSTAWQLLMVAFLSIWLGAQILVPMRHWFIPGNVAWTEDGHRFSWRMKLRSKSGTALFHVKAADKTWVVDPKKHLNTRQVRKMACIPDMVWQFGQFLEREWQQQGYVDISVTVTSHCSLNGRDRQLFFKPELDLTSISRNELAVNWLVPLRQPLKNPFWKI